ncbi:GDSL-type esterase/lipase family protein [Brevibacterium sp. UBA7493]|nr:GDSL-type esterase/lipase family protein [Brevibacterium sp. UBA7493]
MSNPKSTSIVVAGSELVAGHGDGRGLGWVGRVAVRTHPALPSANFYTLAAPEETSADLHDRCIGEAMRRFSSETDNRLVIAPGTADIDAGLSTARSRLNLANILDAALAAEVSTFVVGPPPAIGELTNRSIADLNAGFADVAHRRGVPYVDTFTPLRGHAVWQREIASSSTGLPSQEGYGLLAWLVIHRGWFDWLGVPDVLAGR